jgi:hypothetical protein
VPAGGFVAVDQHWMSRGQGFLQAAIALRSFLTLRFAFAIASFDARFLRNLASTV